jgi:hypothetical protein
MCKHFTHFTLYQSSLHNYEIAFTKTSISVHTQFIAVKYMKYSGTHIDTVHHLQAYYVFLLYLITELYQLSDTVQDPFGQHYCKIHDDDDKWQIPVRGQIQQNGTRGLPVTLLLDLTSESGFTSLW